MCRSRRELSFQIDPNSNEYFLAKFGFDTAENEPCKVCPLSAYGSPRYNEYDSVPRRCTVQHVVSPLPWSHIMNTTRWADSEPDSAPKMHSPCRSGGRVFVRSDACSTYTPPQKFGRLLPKRRRLSKKTSHLILIFLFFFSSSKDEI